MWETTLNNKVCGIEWYCLHFFLISLPADNSSLSLLLIPNLAHQWNTMVRQEGQNGCYIFTRHQGKRLNS